MPRVVLFRPSQTRRDLLLPAALLAAYVTSAAIAYAMTAGSGGLAVLWINNGLLAASLLLLPRGPAIQLAILCIITDFLGAVISGSPPGQALLIAGCDLLESVVAAMLIRRVGGAALDMTNLRRFRRVTLLAVLPATLAVGTLGASLSAVLFANPFIELWPVWAGGDFLGMMIGAPAVLLLARFRRFDQGSTVGRLERTAWIVGSVVVAATIFQTGASPYLYLSFPFCVLLVLRLSPPFAALAILAYAVVAAILTVLGLGPIAAVMPDMTHRILQLQLHLAALQFSALVLISVLAQRGRAQTALKRALTVARETRRSAIEAAGAKGRFLAVMSHEMRTPLNGIAGYAQLLGARDDLPADAREQVRTIAGSSEVLLSLISDVLDYSRTETGGLQLVDSPFRLAEVLTRSSEIVRPMLMGRQIELVLNTDIPDNATYRGDERRLTQVLMNLLGNAAKFTEQGRITLSASVRPAGDTDADDIVLTVQDTGIGIPADKLDLLFNPFTQVDVSDRRSFAGAGLGLAIARALIRRMGGTMGVRSRVGEGSTFWACLTLPRAAAGILAPVATAVDLDHRTARALVVDDHAVNRQVASLMLQAAGFEVATADNGALAVQAVQDGAFDLVFMDLHMPVMDGLTACRAIRALGGATGGLPIIAMTAAAMPEDVDRCLAAGMTDHIAKPIRQEELLQKAMLHLSPGPIVRVA